MNAHGGEVAGHDGEIAIDQRPDLPGQFPLDLVGLLAPGRTAEPPDQGVALAATLVIEAPEIGHDAVPRLARLVAAGRDHLQIAPPSALADAHEHAYIMIHRANV